MAENTEKSAELEVIESQDGSATVDLPEAMADLAPDEPKEAVQNDNSEGGAVNSEDDDHPDDDEELRAAKRNRRRAKKELIRKTNQEKDIRLQQLQRENEEFKRRLNQLERNTKAEQITRLEKNIEDANVSLEYAKMKLAEATQNQDGEAMVEAQTLWRNAEEQVRRLSQIREEATRQLQNPPVQIDVRVQRQAAKWMERNPWYDPAHSDSDSRKAKQIDMQLVREGWDPATQEYWEEMDNRLKSEIPQRYNDFNDDDSRQVRRPRNVVGSAGREASAAYGGSNRTQFVLSPERVRAMKDAGAWDNPERKAKMIKNFMDFDRRNRNN